MTGSFRCVAALAFGAAIAVGCTSLKEDTQAASDAGGPTDGSAEIDAPGETGNAAGTACVLSFDNDETGKETQVSVPYALAFPPANLTAEAWVSLAEDVPLAFEPILGKPYSSGTVDTFILWFQDEYLNGGMNATSRGDSLTFRFTPKANEWHHVALTYDDASLMQRLFLDGIEVAHGAATTPVYDGMHDLMIGADNDMGWVDGSFKGRIADVRLWSVARTAAQLADDMAGCVRADDPTLLLDLPLRDGSGARALRDRTPHHHDGYLTDYSTRGFPTWACGSAPPPVADAGQCTH